MENQNEGGDPQQANEAKQQKPTAAAFFQFGDQKPVKICDVPEGAGFKIEIPQGQKENMIQFTNPDGRTFKLMLLPITEKL